MLKFKNYSKISLLLIILILLNLGYSNEIRIHKYIVDSPTLQYNKKYLQYIGKNIPIGFGSSLFFIKKGDSKLYFFAVTDRGPNADSPDLLKDDKKNPTKIFVTPNFTPLIGIIELDLSKSNAQIQKYFEILNSDSSKTSGLPPSLNNLGSTGEIPLDEELNVLLFDDKGIDSEGITIDNEGYIWICEEYYPSIMKIDPKTFKIIERYYPGNCLPEILKYRQPNRGFEGIAYQDGKIYTTMQSTLNIKENTKDKVDFIRIVEFDIKSKTSRSYAYPLDIQDYIKPSDGMISDMVSIGDKKFLVVERGKTKDGYKNVIYLIDLSNVEPIPEDLDETKAVNYKIDSKYYVKKKEIINLRKYGYNFEKSEGLALIDNNTITIINDNDFGIDSNLSNLKSAMIKDGKIIDTQNNIDITNLYKITKKEENTELWLIEFSYPIK